MLQYQLSCIEGSRGCVIHIAEGSSRRILYLDTLQQLAQEIEKPAVSLLTKIHLRSPNISRARDTASFQQITVPPEHILEVLRLLTRTGRLFLKEGISSSRTDLAVRKQPLQGEWDSFARVVWKGEETGLFSGVIDWKGKEISFGECDALFPDWCIWNGVIFPLKTSVAWKWVEKFFQGPLLLQGAQKKQFLEEDPPILWKKQAPKISLEVFPSLQLTDTTGCFSNLWMEYSGVGRVAFEDLCPTVGKELRLKNEEALWEKDLIESGFARKIVGNSRYYCEGNKVHAVLSFLLELGWKITTREGKKILRQGSISWDIQKHNRGAAIEAQVHFQEIQAPLNKVMQEERTWIDLDGEHVGLLDSKKWESLEGVWEGEKLIVSTPTLLGAFPSFDPSSSCWEESLLQMVKGLRSGGGEGLFLPGKGFHGALLPYQQKGVNFLSILYQWGFSGLLADEMGLGKTVQVLAFFSSLGKNLQALVVAPSSLLYQWKQEIQKFLPDFSVHVHVGPDRLRDLSLLEGIVITSYALLREDVELFSKPFFEVVVLDESNAIKTATTQTSKAASRLQAKFKIALTGTPVENRGEELASQFEFLMPGFLEKKSGLEKLHKRLRPFILRRTKEDVEIELPEKMEHTVWVSMNPRQEEIYRSYQTQFQRGVLSKIQDEGVASHRMEVLEAILRLRQICVDPRLVGEEEIGAKVELLLREIGDRKVLVFSQFTTMLQWVAKALTAEGRNFLYLDGKVSAEDRAESVRLFQSDPNAKIFLLSLKAGGVGLNLTAAEGVFLLDPWWNEAVEQQAIARAHRLGQQKSLIVKRYITPNSIEEKMLRLKERKQGVAELLLSGETSLADVANLTEEDLLHLLT